MGKGKKKAAGNPGKGEKIFKNLCAVCHSLTVSIDKYIYYLFPRISGGDRFFHNGTLKRSGRDSLSKSDHFGIESRNWTSFGRSRRSQHRLPGRILLLVSLNF